MAKACPVTFTSLDGKEYTINSAQAHFVEEYLRNGYNLTQAYIKVYNRTDAEIARPNLISERASRIGRREDVHAYIELRREQIFKDLRIDQKRVIEELAKVGFAVVGDEDVPTSVKVAALDKLAKALGLYEQKSEPKVSEAKITISLED